MEISRARPGTDRHGELLRNGGDAGRTPPGRDRLPRDGVRPSSRLFDEEEEARGFLEQASATGDSFGVRVSTQVVRARDAARAIVDLAVANDVELLVVGAERRRLRGMGSVVFGSTVKHVLQGAPCRVMVIAAPDAEPRQMLATP